MTTLNPDHLLEQAERLASSTGGRHRFADLRRAISSAYYAVFHAVLNEAGDQIVGIQSRGRRDFALVARSIDHGAIRRLCLELAKPAPSSAYAAYLAAGGIDGDLKRFAAGFPTLQDRRHQADYDIGRNFSASDVKSTIESARRTLLAMRRAKPEARRIFVLLLLFPPRRYS